MIEVEVGDTIVEFPAGTPPDVMRDALRRRFSPAQGPTAQQGYDEAGFMPGAGHEVGAGEAALRSAGNWMIPWADEAAEFLKRDIRAPFTRDEAALKRIRERSVAGLQQQPVASALGAGAGIVGSALSIPSRVLQGANYATRGAKAIGLGAGLGAAYGSGDAPEGQRMQGALTGAGFGTVGGAIGHGVAEKIGSALARRGYQGALNRASPSGDALKESYVAAKNAPEVDAVQIKPQAVAQRMAVLEADLQKERISSELAPQTYKLMGEVMRNAKFRMEGLSKAGTPPSFVTMSNIDAVRRRLGDIAKGQPSADTVAATMARRHLDDWLKEPITADDIISGNLQLAHQIFQQGRGNYAAMKLAEALDKRIAKGELQASAQHSGMNVGNIMRQKVTQFLGSSDARALPKPLRDEAERFVRGGKMENLTRFAGKWMGGGGGLGSLASTGVSFSSGLGPTLPIAGFGLTVLSNSLARKDANRLSDLIRATSPLGKQMRAAVGSWEKYAAQAQKKPMTPRLKAMLTIQSRNLSNNLRDAGINLSPESIIRAIQGPIQGRADKDEK